MARVGATLQRVARVGATNGGFGEKGAGSELWNVSPMLPPPRFCTLEHHHSRQGGAGGSYGEQCGVPTSMLPSPVPWGTVGEGEHFSGITEAVGEDNV